MSPKAPRRRTSAQNWNKPRRWNAQAQAFHATHGRRQRVFCASLADVFDNAVDTGWRDDLWALIRECDQLDWLLLTKRPQNIAKMLPPDWGDGWQHVWLGTSAGTQKTANLNLPHLLQIPAVVHFVSAEPMLGPLDLTQVKSPDPNPEGWHFDSLIGGDTHTLTSENMSGEPIKESGDGPMMHALKWVICGGESGSNARPMHPDWTRELRDQCCDAGVPFFFKQWGEWLSYGCCAGTPYIWRDFTHTVDSNGELKARGSRFPDSVLKETATKRVGKTGAGRSLDGQEWNEVPNGCL